MMKVCQKNTGNNLKSSQWPKMKESEQQNKITLNYSNNIYYNTWIYDITILNGHMQATASQE